MLVASGKKTKVGYRFLDNGKKLDFQKKQMKILILKKLSSMNKINKEKDSYKPKLIDWYNLKSNASIKK